MSKKVNLSVNVAEQVQESAKTKGAKVSNSVTSMSVAPTKKETKANFISYLVSKEEISVSKFFRLFNEFKVDEPLKYAEYISAYKLNLKVDYTFDWFKANCPTINVNGKETFAYWKKVSESTPANEKAEYNRITEKGVTYTLVPYVTLKADYTQFLSMFLAVVANVNRLQREKEQAEKKAQKAKEQAEKEQKQAQKAVEQAETIFKEVSEISVKNSIPFAIALNVYTSLKGVKVSEQLTAILEKMQKESKK